MEAINILPSGHGHWKISTHINGKEMSVVTSNSLLIDDLRDDFEDRTYYNDEEFEAEYYALDLIQEANFSYDKEGIIYDRDGEIVNL